MRGFPAHPLAALAVLALAAPPAAAEEFGILTVCVRTEPRPEVQTEGECGSDTRIGVSIDEDGVHVYVFVCPPHVVTSHPVPLPRREGCDPASWLP